MIQTEYGLAYALVFGLIFLGIVAIAVPRFRKADLPENLERQRKEREAAETRRKMLPTSYRANPAAKK